jgi:hypothetical protein
MTKFDTIAAIRETITKETGPGWSVNKLQFRPTSSHDSTSSRVLQGVLRHVSSSLIQIRAVDPKKHQRDQPMFTHSRVRLRDAHTESKYYVSPGHDISRPPEEVVCLEDPAYLTAASDTYRYYQQPAVHEEDKERIERGTALRYCLTSDTETIGAAVAAAQFISQRGTQQSSVSAYL